MTGQDQIALESPTPLVLLRHDIDNQAFCSQTFDSSILFEYGYCRNVWTAPVLVRVLTQRRIVFDRMTSGTVASGMFDFFKPIKILKICSGNGQTTDESHLETVVE